MCLQGLPPGAGDRAQKVEHGAVCGVWGAGRGRWRMSSTDLALSPILFELVTGHTSSDLETVFHKERGPLGVWQ